MADDAKYAPGNPLKPRLRIDSRRRWFPDLVELSRYRALVVLLGRRDITVRYRQTVLGTLWIFAGALVTAGLFSFVFGRIADLPTGGVPYFVFSYAGLMAWNLFSQGLTSASTSLNPNASLISKIYFPRLVLPLSAFTSTLLNTVMSFGIMLVLLAIYDVGITLQILLLPAWLALGVLLALGIGLVLTSFSVAYRDINFVTPVLVSLLLYLSPVAYSLAAVPASLRDAYLLNPIATIIEGCRWSLIGGNLPPAWAITYAVACSALAFVAGLVVFARREAGLADVI
jgi:lipopolysaccharide transport system permease protein